VRARRGKLLGATSAQLVDRLRDGHPGHPGDLRQVTDLATAEIKRFVGDKPESLGLIQR
jgi:hypothetical protein